MTLFLRFLKFGCLAWGGPVAQLGMLKQELVDEEHWITREEFNRVLAVYQVLPGPEAHEMCVYFGMRVKGRIGGLLAGLGFMLPGLILMLLLSWLYQERGLESPAFRAAFGTMQAAVVALILRAVIRIGGHALVRPWHWLIAVAAALVALARASAEAGGIAADAVTASPTLGALLIAGLRAGLLTFGGAYTAIPFLQHDAVGGGWMTNQQFLDGLALSGVIPAPLIIFATFVGFMGGGLAGALVITAAVFAPAFGFTLIGYQHIERLVQWPALRRVLDGVTAAVVGLIAATCAGLILSSVRGVLDGAVFAVALLVLFGWRSRLAIPLIIGGAALVGVLAR